MKKINFLFLFFAFTFIAVQAQNIYYVTAEADGTADGLSWANATTLQAAIAKTTNTSTDIIFVKKGIYTAPATDGLGYFFLSKNDITIYGNCEGTESMSNLPFINKNTVIQTYLQAPSSAPGTFIGRVITIKNSSVKFIGFDISGGDASKALTTYGGTKYGGAVWITGKGTLNYCKVHGATAQNGGGVYLQVGTGFTPASLENCEIYENTSTGNSSGSYGGGGVYTMSGDIYIKNCIVRNNTAIRGGGVFLYQNNATSNTTISNTVIKDNVATIAYGGVQFSKSGNIVNCLITGNTGSTTTGGLGLATGTQLINSTITNNKVTSNNASDAGGVSVSAGIVKNCIIWGNTINNGTTNLDIRVSGNNVQASVSTVTNSCYNISSVSSGFTYIPVLTNNITATDPLFTSSSDFTLTNNSPCKNTGDNTFYDITSFPKDLNNNMRIINSTIDMGAYEYFSTQIINSATNTSNITGSDTYGIIITGQNELIVDNTKTLNSVTVAPTAKLTINNSGNLTSNTIDLQSDETGTATLVNSGTATITTANVQQYLIADRNWYISSPINNAKCSALNLGSSVQYWDEPNATWKTLSVADQIETSRGYISIGTAGSSTTGNVTFSGILNDGNQTISLTRTGTGSYAGFNLIGNPYPSYLNAMSAITAANDDATIAAGVPTTVIEPTIWYRTKGTSAYYFETINTTTGVGTNNSNTGTVTGYIPPMQAFWVRVASGQTGTTLNFTNNLRFHRKTAIETGTVETTPLKVPNTSNIAQKLLRLRVSDGVNADETILVFNPTAKNELDAYDSAKRTNENSAIPEIYTTIENTDMVINGFNINELGNEIPIGFNTGQSGIFTIKASEITNFDAGTQVILKDKELGNELNITDGSDYTFTSDATTTKKRFSIVFKSATNINDINQLVESKFINIYRNKNNRIAIDLIGESIKNASVSVYNNMGQKLVSQLLTNSTTELYSSLVSGVYIVKVNTSDKETIVKVNIQ